MLSLNLRREIMGHLEAGDASSGLSLAHQLIKKFPQYKFEGICYRVIISLDEIGEVKINQGDSFSKDMRFVEQFLEDNGYFNHDDCKAVIVEARIIGFDLEAFLRNELEEFPKNDHEDLEAYLHEAEIIVLEILEKIDEYEYQN